MNKILKSLTFITLFTSLATAIVAYNPADLNRALAGDKNLRRVDLSRVNLNGANLNGVNLSEANLTNANLYKADLSEANLSEAAMARSLVTITEAKVEALQDLDVRSSYNPSYQATGTGTDNIIVVSGKGPGINRLRGHSRLSQIIAQTVFEAIKKSIRMDLNLDLVI